MSIRNIANVSLCLALLSVGNGVAAQNESRWHNVDCSSALDLVRAKQIAETGDTVVLTAGIPSPNISGNVAGVSNIMKIAVID